MLDPRLKALVVMPNFALAGDVGKALNDRVHGFRVTHVPWLSSGLKQLAAEPFDAILLSLSVLDSAFLGVAQIQAASPDTPILVLAAAADQTEAVRAIQHGADDCFFVDDLSSRSLRQCVMNAIQRKQALKEIQAVGCEDAVTGLYNLDGFESVARQAFSACRRQSSKVYVISLHVDGADVSTQTAIAHALGKVGRRFEASPSTCVSRVGAEEFAVLSTLDSLSDACSLLRRSEDSIRALAEKKPESSWTFVFGMAAYDPEYPSSPASVLERARQNVKSGPALEPSVSVA